MKMAWEAGNSREKERQVSKEGYWYEYQLKRGEKNGLLS